MLRFPEACPSDDSSRHQPTPHTANDNDNKEQRRRRRATLTLFWDHGICQKTLSETVVHRFRLRPAVEHLRIAQMALTDRIACRVMWQAAVAACDGGGDPLRSVHVTACHMGDDDLAADLLHHLTRLPTPLRELSLAFSFKGSTVLGRYVEALVRRHASDLRALDLSGNPSSSSMTVGRALAASLGQARQLQRLDVSMNRLGDAALQHLWETLARNPLPALQKLDVSGNQLSSTSLPGLTTVLTHCRHTLTSLNLSGNPDLFRRTQNDNQQQQKQHIAEWIAALRQCTHLTQLALTDCGVDGHLALAVFQTCRGGSSIDNTIPLSQLCLQNNHQIDQGTWCTIFATILPHLDTLRDLHMGNLIYEPTVMLTGLARNLSLECLYLESEALGNAALPFLQRNRIYQHVRRLLLQQPNKGKRKLMLDQRLLQQGMQMNGKGGLPTAYPLLSNTWVEPDTQRSGLIRWQERSRKRRRLYEQQVEEQS